MDEFFDVAIIGGGINGCGIAADAALRGLSVLLIEKDDLASKTSSSSSKLIHGGLRYLEQYDFSLVKKALDERQTLLKIAPHLVYPLPFVLPYQQSMRPTWLLRTGLFLYDHLSRKNRLPRSRLIRRSQAINEPYFSPLTTEYHKGFVFYDCATDDARLTISNALQAREHGAMVLPRTELMRAEVEDELWHLHVKLQSRREVIFKARAVINAAGPWVEQVNQRLNIANRYKMSLVKGSHLVVHKLYEGNHAYLLQNKDKRIVFVIPYHGNTMIGTTDIVFKNNLDHFSISPEEINYLLDLTRLYFRPSVKKEDILTTWSGVRPLLSSDEEKPQALSRDYAYHYSTHPAPAVAIYGGKITTYRQLARETVDKLRAIFPSLPPTLSHKTVLPGGQSGDWDYKTYVIHAREKYHWLEDSLRERLLSTYGTRAELILGRLNKTADLGVHFGHGLYQAEVDYLVEQEWAEACDDILWRRSKLGLQFTTRERDALRQYLEEKVIHAES
ncbi:glycerol-3-phosphate dehydrogenase [Legionella taurinensis]|uniref:Glycerol-3-phosphate dehydrogenase n=1 Tax=Legionella taurinensis TaxID=70611 RepID=A0A3A5L5S6_9GAMM|nr:glycerol-3-phosphate dehydrogenase [Legionella taurinensis]RJT45540.1 glycerol-3-phosphate dehydrogenase [Legionella taurinensis]RJT66156.1 glycerol-3-phosphate dehydrogenase [Legionella taurinensis]STY26322.1 glycerol-3-phosphate dehydrogenase [Legionella taurinensis]